MTPDDIEKFRNRKLTETSPVEDDQSFRDAAAHGANLAGLNLSGVDFSGCDLRDADLNHCKFSRARFQGANLWNADLSDSDLRDACDLIPAQLAATDLTRAQLPEGLREFGIMESANALSDSSSKVFLTMLVAVVYTFLTLATTRDVQIITNANTTNLPILAVEMPIVSFYAVTPAILLALFVYFHIYLQRLWERIAMLPAFFPDGRRLDEKSYPWLLNDLVREQMPRLRRSAPPLA